MGTLKLKTPFSTGSGQIFIERQFISTPHR